MCPPYLYALPTTPGPAPDEMTNVLLSDVHADLDQSICQLLDSLWCNVALVNGMRHDVPDVLNLIQGNGVTSP